MSVQILFIMMTILFPGKSKGIATHLSLRASGQKRGGARCRQTTPALYGRSCRQDLSFGTFKSGFRLI